LACDRSKGIAVEPFVGRGADLSRAIVRVLEAKQPQTTRQISKAVTGFPDQKGTACSTVNKKVREIEKKGYLQKVQVNQRVGGITNYYQLTPNLEWPPTWILILAKNYSPVSKGRMQQKF